MVRAGWAAVAAGVVVACGGGGGHGVGDAGGDGRHGGDGSAAACGSDADCASESCNGEDTCDSASFIAYVDSATGANGAPCTQAQPCKTIGDGLATGQPIVVATGSFDECLLLQFAGFLSLKAGGSGATLTCSAGSPALSLAGHSAFVAGFTFTGTAAGSDQACVIDASRGGDELSMQRVTIAANAACAVRGLDDELSIDRSTITDNHGGGVFETVGAIGAGGSLDITNSFIARNGSAGSLVGGIDYEEAGSPDFEPNVAFDTIVDNISSGGGAGLQCGAPVPFPDNIIAGNLANGSAGQVSGPCTTPASLVQADHAGLGFVNDASDYHLTAASTLAIDRGTAPTQLPVTADVDGDPRPIGSASDIGADELAP
jgi:hypothetical protein|nr:hypothetical protein [Kofleriaceae bacterium]